MKSHVISAHALDGLELKQNIAGSYGNGSHKSLDAVVRMNADGTGSVVFQVESHRVKLSEHVSLLNAIESYNEVK